MDTSRRQFFQVTAGGLVAATGLAGRARLAAAQGPTVKIGTAVLGDFSMVTPILVAQEKGLFRAQGVNAEFQPFRGGPDLVKAVVATESSFNPTAVSAKGAQGLMQLMPATARSLGVEQPLHVEQNLDGGVRYLRSLIDRYGDWSRALAAYNAGPTAVDRYGGVPPYAETRQYVDRVLTYYRRYHGDFPR